MTYYTKQVCEKLGVSSNTVIKLVRSGYLKDYGVRAEGAKKHELRFDSREVNEFAKTYVKRGSKGKSKREKISKEAPPALGGLLSSNGLFSRVSNLEKELEKANDKLDALIKIWS